MTLDAFNSQNEMVDWFLFIFLIFNLLLSYSRFLGFYLKNKDDNIHRRWAKNSLKSLIFQNQAFTLFSSLETACLSNSM